MKIYVNYSDKVKIRFEGKKNMSQEIVLSKKDTQKLAEKLASKKSSSFETK